MDTLMVFGIALIQFLQQFSPALDGLMGFLTFLGTIEFYLILVPLLYWTVDRRLGFRVLLLLASVSTVTDYLKQLLHQPRPYWLARVRPLADWQQYGLPSGHASSTLSIWGLVAIELRRRWLWAGAAVLVFLIGLSRMYQGAHFPHDVVSGWLLGLAALFLFVEAEQWAAPLLRARSEGEQIAIAIAASVGMILVGLLVRLTISGSSDPPEWAAFARNARSLTTYFTNAGAFFGGVVGYIYMHRRASFNPGGSWQRRAARFALGIVGVLIVWASLDWLFALLAEDETIAGYLLRYIRYAATAFYATFGAPAFFLRFKLAKPA